MNHLYLRFNWLDIEKGVYDWSYIDDIMKRESSDNRNCFAGETTIKDILLSFKNVFEGDFDLVIALYEWGTPIKLAILQEFIIMTEAKR